MQRYFNNQLANMRHVTHFDFSIETTNSASPCWTALCKLLEE